MYTALYYPHTTVRNSSLLKTALLLWDRLEFIVPWPDYKLQSANNNRDVDAALELIGKGYYPTGEQRKRTHQLVEDLATSPLPKDFLLSEAKEGKEYLVYPQKFLPETWQALKGVGLAVPKSLGEFEDWSMSQNLGLAIMAMLADSCAGVEKRTVTDRTAAYRLLTQSIAQLHGGDYGQVSDSVERLVTISLRIINAKQFTLKELIKFRQKEEGTGGHRIRQLRHNYLKNIDLYVQRITKSNNNESDVQEIERQFKAAMEDDLQLLKEALKRKATDVFYSKEVGVGILAAAGIAVTPWTVPSAIVGIGALIHKARGSHEKVMLFKLYP